MSTSKQKKSQGTDDRRMTEDDEDRKSRGKTQAADKGLVWSKDVHNEAKEYELVKRDDSHMKNKEVGFLEIGKATPTHAYDVGGKWQLLYKKPGDDGVDRPIGPGISPRGTPKASPKPKKKKAPPPPPPMKIYVRNWDGLTFTLDDVKPKDTIDDIQTRIEDEHHIPREHQRLRLGNQPLDNPDDTLDECDIENRTTLDLDPMEISVREPYSNKKHTLIVEPTETIDEVKDKVEDATGIPKKDQILTYKKRPLDNNRKTLEDYGIQHQDTLDLEPMEIKVRAPDGRIVDLMVDPEDTIQDVKKQVQKKLGIPTEDQRPTFDDKSLPDNSTLEDNDIRHGDVIDLQPMEIKVRAPDGRIIDLVVDPECTIPDIKKQVKKKLGIPTKEQRPTFNGNPLPDDSTLKDNDIHHGDTIDLQPMQIKVRAPDGRTTELDVDPEDTIDDIKKRVKENLGIPTKEQRPTFKNKPLPNDSTLNDNDIRHGDVIDLRPMVIRVRAPDGRTTELNVDPEDTIPDIKKQVEKKLGIPAEDQRPIFNDEPLPDNSTLEDNGISHGDVIDLEPMQIHVKAPDGRTIDLLVSPEDTIDHIKKRVKKKLGIPTEDQRPRFNNNPLPDDSTLNDNDIQHGDTIDLDPMEIKVRAPDGRITKLLVNPDDNIDSIKKRVKKSLGIPTKDQRPAFNGNPLPSNSTLKDNNIRHGDTIDLTPMEIKVRGPDGQTTKLVVDPDDTIDDIKEQVRSKLGIPIEDQRPTFKNAPLADNTTLNDNDIRHGDTINLEPMEIKVRAPDGRISNLSVNPQDTIKSIKKRVKKDLGIPTEDQRPTFNNTPLPNNSTLEENDIHHGDTIDLQPMKIKVRAPDGRSVDLTVDPEDTINDIKDKVKKELDIPTQDQRPTFKNNPLPDESTLKENDIAHGDVIDLQPMEIKVRTPDGRIANLVVNPEDTIDDVKEQVEFKLGIPPADQRPSFNGDLLPPKSTLKDNDIHHGDVIDLEPMEIQVKSPDGRIADLVVNPYDTINDIKEQVKKQLGIPTDDQRPTLNNKTLPDKSTLKDNKIRHGDVIELQPMEIYVIDLDGKKGTYDVDPSDSIEEIKSRVEDKTGVNRELQRLAFEGVLLEEDQDTLKDVGIKHGDTLKLEPWRVHVRLPGGKKITLNVNPKTTTTNDVKLMVKKREGIMTKKQILKHKGNELDDPTTLEDSGVQHDDVIDMALTPPPVKLKVPEKRDLKKALKPDRYGNVTVTTFKTRYDGEPGESFIDGEVKKNTTGFKMDNLRATNDLSGFNIENLKSINDKS